MLLVVGIKLIRESMYILHCSKLGFNCQATIRGNNKCVVVAKTVAHLHGEHQVEQVDSRLLNTIRTHIEAFQLARKLNPKHPQQDYAHR